MTKARVIITGSEGLIGSEVSAHMEKGFDVIRLSRSLGHDLTDEGFVKAFFLENKAGYLVNCFALNDHVGTERAEEQLFDVSLESVREYLNVNVVALFSVCREFAAADEASGIVNIASIYGQLSPVPSLYGSSEKHIGYGLSKAAVIQLTRHLGAHLAPRVRVNCIVPGGVEHEQGADFKERYNDRVPMKRMMKKDELNGLIEYLCSEESSYMTGSVLNIDGGWSCW